MYLYLKDGMRSASYEYINMSAKKYRPLENLSRQDNENVVNQNLEYLNDAFLSVLEAHSFESERLFTNYGHLQP